MPGHKMNDTERNKDITSDAETRKLVLAVVFMSILVVILFVCGPLL